MGGMNVKNINIVRVPYNCGLIDINGHKYYLPYLFNVLLALFVFYYRYATLPEQIGFQKRIFEQIGYVTYI